MTLLICPVRPGEMNEELRFALRSWETNLSLPHLELLTVGFKPTWLNPDMHIEGNYYRSVPFAVFDNISRASKHAAYLGYQSAIYMNDDFFCVEPVDEVRPVRRDMTLAQHIAMFPEQAGLWWPRSLRLTALWLSEAGWANPYSFEVHRPLSASPGGMYEALSRWDGGFTDMVPQWRTMYGAVNNVEAEPVPDVKMGMATTIENSTWISTSDQSWRRYSRSISERFQKPSRWEK